MGRYRTFEIHTDRDLRNLGCSCAEIDFYCYLIRHEKSHACGVFYIPLRTMAREREASEENISTLLSTLQEKQRLYYDRNEEVIWIPQMAPWQIKAGGKRSNLYLGIRKYLSSIYSVVVPAFWEKWSEDFSELTNEIERLHEATDNNGNNAFNVNGNDKINVSDNVLCSLFSVNCSSLNKKTFLLQEEPSKKTRAKQRKTSNEEDDYIDNIWKLCSQVRHSYRESGLAPITGKGRAHVGTISKFAKQQFELNEWPVSTENTLAYIGLLYEAFMNYDGEERDKKTGEDWIKDKKYPFGSFVQGLEKWAEKAAKVTDSTGRKVYVPLKVPEDVLRFDTCGSGCDHSTARVEAFIKRNKKHAKQIREFKAMAKDGVKYDEYMKQQAGDGEEKAINDGQENTVSAGS